MKTRSVRETAEAAKRASRTLASLTEAQRNTGLEAMAVALQHALPELLKANAKDLAVAAELLASGELSSATVQRLKLDEGKLAEMVQQVRAVAALPDPLGRKLDAIEMDDADPEMNGAAAHGLHMQKISVPLGVLAVIFEARPDAVTQIAALALKSGNAAILKPGREVEHTAEALVGVLRSALAGQKLPEDSVSLVMGREQVKELLGQTSLVDMVIPRGSKALVEYVQANTRIPVLGHSEGICHIYVDRDVDEAMALRVIEDAKCDYPAACNAVETVLVHQDIAETFLPKLAVHLRKCGVTIHADALAAKPMGGVDSSDDWNANARSLTAQGAGTSSKTSGGVNPVDDWTGSSRSLTVDDASAKCEPVGDWHTEYGELAVSVGVVASLDAAIEHIHTHGSSHTETIMTEDAEAAARFLREVDAAAVLHNASTRFADGFRFGFGAEVGISTSKFHARGPVGLEGLTTYKYVVRGNGHVAGDYRGKNARAFTHRKEVV